MDNILFFKKASLLLEMIKINSVNKIVNLVSSLICFFLIIFFLLNPEIRWDHEERGVPEDNCRRRRLLWFPVQVFCGKEQEWRWQVNRHEIQFQLPIHVRIYWVTLLAAFSLQKPKKTVSHPYQSVWAGRSRGHCGPGQYGVCERIHAGLQPRADKSLVPNNEEPSGWSRMLLWHFVLHQTMTSLVLKWKPVTNLVGTTQHLLTQR